MGDEEAPRKRGRPRTRFAERDEQVRQNMRLYRARRAAELAALAKALDRLGAAVAAGDLQATFREASATVGLWATGTIKDNVIKNRRRRKTGAGDAPARAEHEPALPVGLLQSEE
jgi:hypothetical protein